MPHRLRILRAKYQGFGPHRGTELDLSEGRIHNLVGPFGSGKSFVGEGLRWCVEGASVRPVEYDPGIGGGEPVACRVEFDLAIGQKNRSGFDEVKIWRTPSSSSHSKQALYELLGIRESSRTAKDDLTLFDLLLNPQRFFEVPADARLRFIDRTFGTPLTLGELEAAGVSDSEVARACLRSLKAGIAKATEGRRSAERLAEATTSTRPEDAQVDILGQKRTLSQMEPGEYADRIRAAKGKRDGVRDRGNAILQSLKAIEALAKAEAAYKAHVLGAPAKAAADARETVASAQTMVADAEGALRGLEGKANPCPACGVDRNLKEVATLREAIAEAKQKSTGAAFTVREFDAEEARLKKSVEGLKEAAPAGDEEEAKRLLAQAAKMEEQIQGVEAVVARAAAYHSAIDALAEGEKKRVAFLEEAAKYRAMEGAIEGLVKSRGSGPVPRLQTKVANVAEKIGFPCALTDDGEVLVKGAPIIHASKGQRLYAALVVGTAVASLSGAGFLFVDDFGTVDHAARIAVFKLLLAMVKGEEPMLEQVFLVTLTGPEKPSAPPESLKGVYRVFSFTGVGLVEEVK